MSASPPSPTRLDLRALPVNADDDAPERSIRGGWLTRRVRERRMKRKGRRRQRRRKASANDTGDRHAADESSEDTALAARGSQTARAVTSESKRSRWRLPSFLSPRRHSRRAAASPAPTSLSPREQRVEAALHTWLSSDSGEGREDDAEVRGKERVVGIATEEEDDAKQLEQEQGMHTEGEATGEVHETDEEAEDAAEVEEDAEAEGTVVDEAVKSDRVGRDKVDTSGDLTREPMAESTQEDAVREVAEDPAGATDAPAPSAVSPRTQKAISSPALGARSATEPPLPNFRSRVSFTKDDHALPELDLSRIQGTGGGSDGKRSWRKRIGHSSVRLRQRRSRRSSSPAPVLPMGRSPRLSLGALLSPRRRSEARRARAASETALVTQRIVKATATCSSHHFDDTRPVPRLTTPELAAPGQRRQSVTATEHLPFQRNDTIAVLSYNAVTACLGLCGSHVGLFAATDVQLLPCPALCATSLHWRRLAELLVNGVSRAVLDTLLWKAHAVHLEAVCDFAWHMYCLPGTHPLRLLQRLLREEVESAASVSLVLRGTGPASRMANTLCHRVGVPFLRHHLVPVLDYVLDRGPMPHRHSAARPTVVVDRQSRDRVRSSVFGRLSALRPPRVPTSPSLVNRKPLSRSVPSPPRPVVAKMKRSASRDRVSDVADVLSLLPADHGNRIPSRCHSADDTHHLVGRKLTPRRCQSADVGIKRTNKRDPRAPRQGVVAFHATADTHTASPVSTSSSSTNGSDGPASVERDSLRKSLVRFRMEPPNDAARGEASDEGEAVDSAAVDRTASSPVIRPEAALAELPSRATSSEGIDQDLVRDRAHAEIVLRTVLDSLTQVPPAVHSLCHLLHSAAMLRFPDDVATIVAGFYILRFVGPSILTPGDRGLFDDPPTPQERKRLIMITKVLQHMANGTTFSDERSVHLNVVLHRYSAQLRSLCARVFSAGPPLPGDDDGHVDVNGVDDVPESVKVDGHRLLLQYMPALGQFWMQWNGDDNRMKELALVVDALAGMGGAEQYEDPSLPPKAVSSGSLPGQRKRSLRGKQSRDSS